MTEQKLPRPTVALPARLCFEMVAGVVLPEDLLKQGYGYARYGFRKEDCSLRSMYSQGVAEARGAGSVSTVLKQHGFGDRNLFVFPVGE